MRVDVVDPSAFTPPYDAALCAALARAGADVSLVTSRFAYGAVPALPGYRIDERFYRHAVGGPGSALRRVAKLAEHVPDMLAYRRAVRADVVHFQWLALQWLDRYMLPARVPLVLTAHDLLPREPRPGQTAAQRRLYERVDAVVVHSEYGRSQLVQRLGVDAGRVHVIHHGAFEHLAALPDTAPLAPELAAVEDPVVLFFGLIRPYKGLDTLLEAWRGVSGAELWVVGRPRMPLPSSPAPNVRFVSRHVSDRELPAYFRRADVVVLPYKRTERLDFSGVLATALAFGRATIVSDIGGFSEVAALGAARLVAPDDVEALHAALIELLSSPDARAQLASGALAARAGAYSWDGAARETLALYEKVLGEERLLGR